MDVLIYGGSAMAVLLILFIAGACRVASDSDDWSEQLAARMAETRENASRYQSSEFSAREALEAVQLRRQQQACAHPNMRMIDQAAVECVDCGRSWPNGPPSGITITGGRFVGNTAPAIVATPVRKPKRRTWGRE